MWTGQSNGSLLTDKETGIECIDASFIFYSIRNFVSYRAKTLRGIALRRQGNQSQATPPQAAHFAKRNAFLFRFPCKEIQGLEDFLCGYERC